MALTAEAFESFLALLSRDRDAAGEQYEIVRLKLAKYFELRMCAAPDDLADETIDRVARRIAEGEQIQSQEPMRYIYGVARRVFLESFKSERRQTSLSDVENAGEMSGAEVEWRHAERRLDCLEWCLDQVPARSRELLVRYYEHTGREKVEGHAELARQMAIPLNALRIRVHRIKSVILRCIETCIGNRAV